MKHLPFSLFLFGSSFSATAMEVMEVASHNGATPSFDSITAHSLPLLLDFIRDKKLLHAAARENTPQIVELLLRSGNSPDEADEGQQKRTPLHYAAQAGNHTIVAMLLKAGACVNAQDINGTTPLYLAALANHQKTIEVLLEHDADPKILTCTMLNGHMYYTSPLDKAIDHRNLAAGKLLLEAGAPVNKKDSRKDQYIDGCSADAHNTPLFAAVLQPDFNLFELLLEKEADINIVEQSSRKTLLHHAVQSYNQAKKSYKKIIARLVAKGSPINAQDRWGSTPLHYAVHDASNKEVITLLLQLGADKSIQNKLGHTPTDQATGQLWSLLTEWQESAIN